MHNLIKQQAMNPNPQSPTPNSLDCIIIGGGISGLTAAFYLKNKGHNILLLEKENSVGGNIKTLNKNDFLLETGPHTFMGSSESIWQLIQDSKFISHTKKANPISNNRYIYKNEALMPLPLSPWSFIKTPLLSLKAKLRLACEPFIPGGAKDQDTAWDFFCRRFGQEAATYIMSPFVSGIYAGDVKKLGAKPAFPKFWNFEKTNGSMIRGAFKYMRAKKKRLKKQGIELKKGLYSFEKGLGAISEHLGSLLKEQTLTNTNIKSIEYKNNLFSIHCEKETHIAKSLIIATPPQETASLLNNTAPKAKSILNQIPMAPVVLIHWTLPKQSNPYPHGFGFLMPTHYPFRVLGTLFPSDLYANRAPLDQALFASFYGGMNDSEATKLSNEELTKLVHEEHKRILKTNLPDFRVLKILRYNHAIPQLLPSHLDTVAKLQEIIKTNPGLFLAGNYLTGVGMEHAAHSGIWASEKVCNYLKPPPLTQIDDSSVKKDS